jgi:hypothetical protein
VSDESLREVYWAFLRERGRASEFHDLPQLFEGLERPGEDEGYSNQFLRQWLNHPYGSFHEVAHERRSTLLERLATVATWPRPFSGLGLPALQELLDLQSRRVEGYVTSMGETVPPVFCGLFPTGSLNAQAVPVKGGALVLVHTGLMRLLYGVAKINVASAWFNDTHPLIDKRQTAVALGELLNAYVFGGNPTLARELPPLQAERRTIAEELAQTCEHFILAHEYAHALRGHLDRECRFVTLKTPIGDLDVLAKRRQQEFEADQFALKLLAPALVPAPDASPRAQARLFAGVLLVFYVDGLITLIAQRSGRNPSIVSDHPPSEERARRVVEQLTKLQNSPIAFDLIEELAMWFVRHEEMVFQLLDDVDNLRPDRESR